MWLFNKKVILMSKTNKANIIKVSSAKATPLIDAIKKKQEYKEKVASGEIKVVVSKGAKFA